MDADENLSCGCVDQMLNYDCELLCALIGGQSKEETGRLALCRSYREGGDKTHYSHVRPA